MKERNVNLLGKLLVLAVVFGMLTPLIADAQQGTEARLKKLESELQALKAERAEAVPEWIRNIKFSGDFRYRLESIDAETGGDWAQGHNRHRVRARFNIGTKLDEEWDLGFRLASGSADPASTNQTLADSPFVH